MCMQNNNSTLNFFINACNNSLIFAIILIHACAFILWFKLKKKEEILAKKSKNISINLILDKQNKKN